MDLKNEVKDWIITKLGTLMYANAELGAQNAMLFLEVNKQAKRIAELEAQMAAVATKAENLPANPYENAEVKH